MSVRLIPWADRKVLKLDQCHPGVEIVGVVPPVILLVEYPPRTLWSPRASRGTVEKAPGQGLILGCSVNFAGLSCLRPPVSMERVDSQDQVAASGRKRCAFPNAHVRSRHGHFRDPLSRELPRGSSMKNPRRGASAEVSSNAMSGWHGVRACTAPSKPNKPHSSSSRLDPPSRTVRRPGGRA